VAALEDGGHDTTEARKLLEQFEEVQVMHINDGERLKEELRSGAMREAQSPGRCL
jgi:hypothetical protein